MIKAIPTIYAGHRFRSRAEARWAVFFDALDIEWQYETQGYQVQQICNDAAQPRYYLPDFFLPRTKTWVEVKGDQDDLNFQLLADLTDWGGSLPHIAESWGSAAGLLVLGEPPRPIGSGNHLHPILQHHEGGFVELALFEQGGLKHVSLTGMENYFDSSWGGASKTDPWAKTLLTYFGGKRMLPEPNSAVAGALTLARSARFEHGETPVRAVLTTPRPALLSTDAGI